MRTAATQWYIPDVRSSPLPGQVIVDDNVLSFHRPPRLLVVGATMGAGHMTAAWVLADRLAARGAEVRVVDYLALPRGPQGHLVREFYRLLVHRAPWCYDAIMRAWMAHPELFERLSAVGEGAYAHGLLREVHEFGPDAVVSTYNLAGQLLGRLRQRGRLRVPVLAYVTDAGAHPYWVASGADMHLAPLAETGQALSALGARNVVVVAPLVRPPSALSREHARARLGVPADVTAVLVNGGSWGVGDIVDAAHCVAATGPTAYVLCGSSERLATAVAAMPNCRAIGWTDEVATWLTAADVLVDSAGGTTCWEALVAHRPVVLHRPLAGHGRLNATTLQQAGLARVTWTAAELVAGVAAAADRDVRAAAAVPAAAADAADLVLTAA